MHEYLRSKKVSKETKFATQINGSVLLFRHVEYSPQDWNFIMSPTQPFRLLDLPLEVRAMIFSEMLVEEKWIYKSTVDVEGKTRM